MSLMFQISREASSLEAEDIHLMTKTCLDVAKIHIELAASARDKKVDKNKLNKITIDYLLNHCEFSNWNFK